MQERRLEARLLCADLIDVHWTDKSGRSHTALANLEDISISGPAANGHARAPRDHAAHGHPKTEFAGRVRYCVSARPATSWRAVRARFPLDPAVLPPKHLLDPRRLVALSVKRAVKKPEDRQEPPTQPQ